MLIQQQHDLQELEKDITEEEIHKAVMELHPEKAPGPDGYTWAFFKVYWDIIQTDLVAAIKDIFALWAGCWNLLKSAHVVLIEKKAGAKMIGDYRPISIMHSIAKILAKILATWLAPYLDKLVSPNQSAFIKGRIIHDNLQYVKGALNHFHSAKTPMLLLKLDIAKAFDNVIWEYLLEVMQKIGFGQW
jgi:retron-type reverse transcriptase